MKEQVIIDFCNQIMSTSSTKAKKEIVASFKDNKIVTQFLQFLLDKQVVTGISTKKLNKEVRYDAAGLILTDIENAMHYLALNNTGTDSDIVAIQNYLDRMEAQVTDVSILGKIFTKTLKLGIDAKLVNAAIPGLIPVHEVQQAYALKNAKLDTDEWICLSEKLNGNRATFINYRILSRQGKEFSNIDHILDELVLLESKFDSKMVFDGEIIRKNVDNLPDNENFRIGTGLLTSDAEDKTSLGFVIFDVLPLEEFRTGESRDTYRTRLLCLETLREYTKDMEHISVVPILYSGTDHSMIQKCLDDMDSKGKEGCMLARDVTYKCKRHNGLLKVKTFYTMDLPIVGFETGTGKNENTLGNVLVKYKDKAVGVGSGFTDEMRNWIWANRNSLLGRVIEVKYKDITKDKITGQESLQFPVFVGFREEGKIISYD